MSEIEQKIGKLSTYTLYDRDYAFLQKNLEYLKLHQGPEKQFTHLLRSCKLATLVTYFRHFNSTYSCPETDYSLDRLCIKKALENHPEEKKLLEVHKQAKRIRDGYVCHRDAAITDNKPNYQPSTITDPKTGIKTSKNFSVACIKLSSENWPTTFLDGLIDLINAVSAFCHQESSQLRADLERKNTEHG